MGLDHWVVARSKEENNDDEGVFIAEWRKANAIHKWFVKHVQKGLDDCEEYQVTRDQLLALKNLCAQVLKTKNTKLLPTQSGFFFGGTDYDDYYWDQLKETIDMLGSVEKFDDSYTFYYQASW